MIPSLFDRSEYPSLSESVYLNQASLGLIGQPAVAAMHAFLDNVARHGNLRMSDRDEIKYCDALRKHAARLFQNDPSRVAIIASASEMMAQFPLLLPLRSKPTVLLVSSDFPAVTRPWLRQSLLGSVHVRFVEDLPEHDLTDVIIDATDENTGVIAISNVQYMTGTAVDVPRLAKIAKQMQAFLIVDATQSAGAMKLDTKAFGDAVVTSGYKWLGGHGGVALAVISDSLLEQIPVLTGWMSAPEPFAFDAKSISFASDARRFTQSTMSYVSIAGLTASIEQMLRLGEGTIKLHARRLAATLVDGARESGWNPFRDIHDAAASSHIISLGHARESAEMIVEKLRTKNIVCSARGNRIRVSLAPYNDATDVDSFVEGLARLTAGA